MEEAMKLMTKFINSGLDPMFFIKESFLVVRHDWLKYLFSISSIWIAESSSVVMGECYLRRQESSEWECNDSIDIRLLEHI